MKRIHTLTVTHPAIFYIHKAFFPLPSGLPRRGDIPLRREANIPEL